MAEMEVMKDRVGFSGNTPPMKSGVKDRFVVYSLWMRLQINFGTLGPEM